MKIAIFSYRYPIEISLTIKGIASYVAEKTDHCPIFIDQFYADAMPDLKGVTVHVLKSSWFIKLARLKTKLNQICSARIVHIIFRLFDMGMKKTEELLVLPRVKAQLSQYDCVYAMEIHSLVLLFKSGLNLDKVIYFSLESDQIINEYDKKYVTELLKQCYSCVIQCKERGDDFKRKLKLDVDFQYLPVSLRPVKLMRKSHGERIEQPLQIVYSGFFSEWSCLKEFLTQVANTDLLAKSQITLQGHALGTERYFAELVSKFGHYDNIRINSEFIEDSKFLQFLKDFDIGLAFYNGNKTLSNWNNLLYASGKIACYLWAGLAVMTNIDTAATKEPPFIFIDNFCKVSIEQRLREYNKKSSDYQIAAIAFARRYYNLDGYMYNIYMDTEKQFDR